MRTTKVLRLVVFVACLVLAVGAVTLFASGRDDTDRPGQITSDQPSARGADELQSSLHEVMNKRRIDVPDSSKVVHLWEAVRPDGTEASYYSIGSAQAGDTADRPLGSARQADYGIPLRHGRFDPLLDSPAVDFELRAGGGNELYLVQYWTSPLEEFSDQIKTRGGTVYRYLPEQTQIVRMSAARAAEIAQLPYVRWVGEFQPAYKLAESILAARSKGLDAVEGAREGFGEYVTKNEYSIEVFERAGGSPSVERAVEYGDAGVIQPGRVAPVENAPAGLGQQGVVKEAIEAMGGRVSVVSPGGFRMQATLTMEQLVQVAQMNEVHFIEPWGYGGTDMDIVRGIGGANFIETTLGYTGQGVRAEVFDSEVRTTHTEFSSLLPTLHSATAGNPFNPHGTSVYSIMFARGASANARGLLPNAERGYFFWGDDSTQFGGAVTRLQIATDLVQPSGTVSQAVLQTSSLGNDRTTSYTSISSEMDDVIFRTGLLHMQSQSNAATATNGTAARLSRPQAWAKNIVSVGAVNHYDTTTRADDTWVGNGTGCGTTTGTSVGPAEDSRIKPDLSFFYDCTLAADNSSDSAYTQFGGTSGATPSVSGYMGLFHQMWQQNVWAGSGMLTSGTGTVFSNRPKAMLAKAALINSAFRYDWTAGTSRTLPGSIDRYVQGWGMPNLQNLYNLRNKTFYVNESSVLRQGESKTHAIKVAPGESQLNVTMTYMDPPGTTSSTLHRINDLSLKVTSPGGTVYWGNNGLAAGNVSTSGGSPNTRDTVENVFIPSPEAGNWSIQVQADVVVQDAHTESTAVDADYALWVTGGTESGSLTTTYAAGNSQNGAMFDITAHEPVTLTGFDLAHTSTSPVTVEVYYTPGGYAGKEENAGAWTLMGSATVQPKGSGVAAFVNIGGLNIKPGETYGIYITEIGVATGFMQYTDGSESFDNGEILIQTGVGKAYPFGMTFTPRTWNGTVYYRSTDPELGPFAYSIQSNGDQRLYRINLLTGLATPMGAPMAFSDAEGLAIGPTGTVYGIGGTTHQLWNVGSPTGLLIGATGTRNGIDAGLDYYNGVLYNINGDSSGSTLYRVNPSNGSAVAVGSTGIFLDSLAIRADGVAFAADWAFTDSLYRVNLATGSATLVGSLGLGDVSQQSGLAFLGGTLYAITDGGKLYRVNTDTGAASFVANVTTNGVAIVGSWEGLAISPCSAAVPVTQEGFGSTFSDATRTRGYWFTAPADFLIVGLRVPDEAGAGVQNVEVVRFDGSVPPPSWLDRPGEASTDFVRQAATDAVTNAFVSLFRRVGAAGSSIISTSIPVRAGDTIGILGAAGTTIMNNSYAVSNTYQTEILGKPVTLKRLGMQYNLNTTQARDLWTEDVNPFSRVEMYYIQPPDLVLDADTVATGSTINTTPLFKPVGTVSATGTVEIRSTDDPDLAAAGSVGSVFDILDSPTSTAEIVFNFDVESITFIYGGNLGSIRVEARDKTGAVVDSFFQATTDNGDPAGPQILAGPGIRRLYWEDPGNNFAPLDNICIMKRKGGEFFILPRTTGGAVIFLD